MEESKWENKVHFLEVVKNDGLMLRKASLEMKNDKDVVLEAVKQNGYSLCYASDALKNDKEFVIDALEYNISSLVFGYNDFPPGTDSRLSLEFVSETLKKDKDVVRVSVQKNGMSLLFASPMLQDDKEIVFLAVNENGSSLQFASSRLQDDKEIVLKSVGRFGFGLKYSSENMRGNKEVVLESIKNMPSTFEFANGDLRRDRDFVLDAVKENGMCLAFASVDLRNDKIVVHEAVNKEGGALQFASEGLRNDVEIVFSACVSSRSAFSYVGKDLAQKSPLLSVVQEWGGDIENAIDHSPQIGEIGKIEEFILDCLQNSSGTSLSHSGLECYRRPKSPGIRAKEDEEDLRERREDLKDKGFKDFEFLRLLGRGVYGGAYLSRIIGVKGIFVVKIYNDDVNSVDIKRENNVSRDSLDIPYHPNVVTILKHWVNERADVRKLPDYEEFWKEEVVDPIVPQTGMIVMKFHRTTLQFFLSSIEEERFLNIDELVTFTKSLVGVYVI